MAGTTTHRGRRVLVTGATRGVGLTIMSSMLARGADVVGCNRGRPGRTDAGVESGDGAGPLVVADVTNEADVKRLIQVATDIMGGLDVVINNVGYDDPAPLTLVDQTRWTAMLETNLGSAYLVTRAALPHLGAGSAVINVGASAAIRGRPMASHYIAAKAGLHGLTVALAKELGPRQISVNTIAPGLIARDDVPANIQERVRSSTPMGRLTTADDVAAIVAALTTTEVGFTSGNIITVDGAY